MTCRCSFWPCILCRVLVSCESLCWLSFSPPLQCSQMEGNCHGIHSEILDIHEPTKIQFTSRLAYSLCKNGRPTHVKSCVPPCKFLCVVTSLERPGGELSFCKVVVMTHRSACCVVCCSSQAEANQFTGMVYQGLLLSERRRLRTESIEEHLTPSSLPAQWPGNDTHSPPPTLQLCYPPSQPELHCSQPLNTQCLAGLCSMHIHLQSHLHLTLFRFNIDGHESEVHTQYQFIKFCWPVRK